MKVVGIGLQKTGTTTLGRCLRELGYKHQSFDQRAVGMRVRGAQEELLSWINRYESFDDIPWCLMYRDIDQLYPDSKFILTRRQSPAIWLQSFVKHLQRVDDESQQQLRTLVYGAADLASIPARATEVYQRHLDEARDYFSARPDDFLEVCWEDGDGWDTLASFLSCPKPQSAFPHANAAPSWWKRARTHWQNRNKKPAAPVPIKLLERPGDWRGE